MGGTEQQEARAPRVSRVIHTVGPVTWETLYRHPWRSKPYTVSAAAANPGPLRL